MADDILSDDDTAREREAKLAKKRIEGRDYYRRNRDKILAKLHAYPPKPMTDDDRSKARKRQARYRATGKRRVYERAYEEKNKDKINARRRARNANNPSITAKHKRKYRANPRVRIAEREYMLRWLADNRDRRAIYSRNISHKFREKRNLYNRMRRASLSPEEKMAAAAYHRAWVRGNPEKIKAIRIAREGRERGASGTFSASDIADIRRMQRDRCAYCRARLFGKGHVDHIKAIANGGTNNRNNLQLTCGPCNQSKSSLDPIIFARRKGKLI